MALAMAACTTLSQAKGAAVAARRGLKSARRAPRQAQRTQAVCAATQMQFIKGVTESTVPDVRLTRAKDGSSGTAYFSFQTPDVFEASVEMGEITGLYLVDDEGEISTTDVQAKFINGKPSTIDAKLVMRSALEWDRFMRFMERYAEDNSLGFNKAS